MFIGRTDAEGETPVLWPPHAELTHWKRPWCWEGLGAGGEGDDRGWDVWIASATRWTWVLINSRSWWWTGRPGVLRFMGSQRVRHDWVTELTDWLSSVMVCKCVCYQLITSLVQINSSVPILKKKGRGAGGAGLFNYFFPLWTCQHRALRRCCRRKELLSQLQLQGGFQAPPRFVQGWLKRKMECKIPDIQFLHKKPCIPFLIRNYTWFQYCGGWGWKGHRKIFFLSPMLF